MLSRLSSIVVRGRSIVVVRPSLIRAFAGKVSDVAKVVKEDNEKKDLSSVLTREIAFEKEDQSAAASLTELRSTLSADWAVSEAAGSARFSMTKKVGTQAVTVDLDITPMPSEDEYPEEDEAREEGDEEPQTPADGYRMIVTVDGGKGKAMQFGCFITDHLRIHRVTIHESSKLPTAADVFGGSGETGAYAGPDFEELDTALQNSFYEYLENR